MAEKNDILPILIVGAGPAGLAAALTLAQNGVRFRIIDKTSQFHRLARGTGLHSRTLEMFHFLGILPDALKTGGPVPTMRSYKLPGGTEVLRTWGMVEEKQATPDRPYTDLMMSQYLTEGIFRDHLAKYGVKVELRTEPELVEQDESGMNVTLKKVDEAGNESLESIKVGCIIGADGARGVMRKCIGATFEGLTKDADGQVWAECVAEGQTSDFWHVWSEPGKFTITMRPKPDGPGMFHMGIMGMNFDPVDLVDQTKFIDFFYEATGRKDITFKEVETITYWKPKMRKANKFAEGRIFIVGDAAHVHSPTGGQGLNTSVQDSFNLSWKLALACKGIANPSLLDSFQIERLPVVAQMLVKTSNLYTHGVVARTVDDVEKSTSGSGFLQWRDRALSMLDVNYRWSPVVFDERGTQGRDENDMKALAYQGYGPEDGVHAGDRAPDAPGLVAASGEESSLFHIFKPFLHTVLIFPSGEEGVADAVEAARNCPPGTAQVVIIGSTNIPSAVHGTTVYHDRQGTAWNAYHIAQGTFAVVVVRPDAYVGAFVYGSVGLQSYFAKIFKTT